MTAGHQLVNVAATNVLSTTVVDRSTPLPLTEATQRYAQAAFAKNTKRAYQSAWSEYATWCAVHGIDPLPPHPHNTIRYITRLADDGAQLATIAKRLSAMRHVFKAAGYRGPLDDEEVAHHWAGIRNTIGKPAVGAKALYGDLLWQLVDNAPPHDDNGNVLLANVRDRAIVLIGFWAALRRSELANIDVEHITEHPLGYVITVPRSKMNQTGIEPEYKLLPRKTTNRCPVEALDQWQHYANIQTGPLLRGLNKNSQPRPTRLGTSSIAHLLNNMLTNAGQDPNGFSPHSLRAGFITAARLAQIDTTAIMHQTDQHSSTIDRYTRILDIGTHNAAALLQP
jgi:integrase